MSTGTRLQTPDEAVCISQRGNNISKGMNTIILLYLRVNSREELVLKPWLCNQTRRMKTLNSKSSY